MLIRTWCFRPLSGLAGNDAHAADIAQEVFLKAYENFGHLRTSATAGGWLRTVTTNLSLNHLTRYRKRWRLFSEMRSAADDEDNPDPDVPLPDTLLADLGAEQQRDLIEAALRRLPEHQRVVLVLAPLRGTLVRGDIAAPAGVSRQGEDRHSPCPCRHASHAAVRRGCAMTEPADAEGQLARLFERTLRDLPLRRAPSTLEARVLSELRRRASLPWWRRSFSHWPALARACFGLGIAVLIAWIFAGGALLMENLQSLPVSGRTMDSVGAIGGGARGCHCAARGGTRAGGSSRLDL